MPLAAIITAILLLSVGGETQGSELTIAIPTAEINVIYLGATAKFIHRYMYAYFSVYFDTCHEVALQERLKVYKA